MNTYFLNCRNVKNICCKFFLHSQSVLNLNGSHAHWRQSFCFCRILPSFWQWVWIMCSYLKQYICILHYGISLHIVLLLQSAMCSYGVFEYLAIYMYNVFLCNLGGQCFHRMPPSCNLSVWATLSFSFRQCFRLSTSSLLQWSYPPLILFYSYLFKTQTVDALIYSVQDDSSMSWCAKVSERCTKYNLNGL